MGREFSIKASIFGTDEYNRLQQARRDYDKYGVERKTIKRNPKKESFKGLTYTFMEEYMDRYNVSAEIRQEYNNMRFDVKCHSIRYPYIKKWFLKTFPDIKTLGFADGETDNVENAAADTDEVA